MKMKYVRLAALFASLATALSQATGGFLSDTIDIAFYPPEHWLY